MATSPALGISHPPKENEWCEKQASISISFISWQVKDMICLHFISKHSDVGITLYALSQSP